MSVRSRMPPPNMSGLKGEENFHARGVVQDGSEVSACGVADVAYPGLVH